MNLMPKRKVWGSIDEGPDKEEKAQEKKMEEKKEKYTREDVIFINNDPRLKDAIGKMVYFSDSASKCINYANEDLNSNVLQKIYNCDASYPFKADNVDWKFIILKKESSYAERQAQWIKANDIKVGAHVRFIRFWTYEDSENEGYDFCCCYTGYTVGSVGVIIEICDDSIKIKSECGEWWYPYFILEKVEKKYIPFDLSNEKHKDILCEKGWVKSKITNIRCHISFIGKGFIGLNDKRTIAEDLLAEFTFLDGTPCGVEE